MSKIRFSSIFAAFSFWSHCSILSLTYMLITVWISVFNSTSRMYSKKKNLFRRLYNQKLLLYLWIYFNYLSYFSLDFEGSITSRLFISRTVNIYFLKEHLEFGGKHQSFLTKFTGFSLKMLIQPWQLASGSNFSLALPANLEHITGTLGCHGI